MISRSVIQLVLLISCAHAFVHIMELSLPSVEQEIDTEFQCGKELTGWMGTCWRVPWGIGALAAGWLVDRWGSRRMLAVYLLGCATMCVLTASAATLPAMFLAMFGMGMFASIYHPAGLALISHATTPQQRGVALGVHGVFGSLGIGSAPLFAGVLLAWGMDWRTYYVNLSIPTALLGLIFLAQWRHDRTMSAANSRPRANEQTDADWPSYFILTGVAMLSGITYSACLHFLARYLHGTLTAGNDLAEYAGSDKWITGGVLLIGCAGQILAGMMARPKLLEKQLTAVVLFNVPSLVLMAYASGPSRIVTAGFFTFVHFMYQPIYNSLVAKYTPVERRSLSYGFSIMVGLGFGGFGPALAGYLQSDRVTYVSLAVCSALAALLSYLLVRRSAVSDANTSGNFRP